MEPVTGGLLSGGMKLLGGLFGNSEAKREGKAARAWELNQQEFGLLRMRHAAELAGFNPLTALNATGGGPSFPGGGGSSGPALASQAFLTGAMTDFSDVVSGEASRRRAANDLEIALQKVKLEALRSGVVQVKPSATASVGSGLPVLGKRSATVVPPAGSAMTSRGPVSLADPDFVPKKEASTVVYKATNGQTIEVPVAPDPEEIVAGVALEAAAAVKASKTYSAWERVKAIGSKGSALGLGGAGFSAIIDDLQFPKMSIKPPPSNPKDYHTDRPYQGRKFSNFERSR